MKKILLCLVVFSSPALAADGFATAAIYQADFDNAWECEAVDGRRVWEGEQAFYIQAWAGPDTDELSETDAIAMAREELTAGDLAI